MQNGLHINIGLQINILSPLIKLRTYVKMKLYKLARHSPKKELVVFGLRNTFELIDLLCTTQGRVILKESSKFM